MAADYEVTILPGSNCFANGINDQGQVVGFTVDGAMAGIWWLPGSDSNYQNAVADHDPNTGVLLSKSLKAINNMGLVIPGAELTCINWGNANFTSLSSGVIENATALNNSGQVVSGTEIYFWPLPKAKPIQLPNIDESAVIAAMNDAGDVVGQYGSSSAFIITAKGAEFGIGLGSLADINVHQLVVGAMTDSAGVGHPGWTQIPSNGSTGLTLKMTPIQVPPGTLSGGASAVNNSGIIVDTAANQDEEFAFVVPKPGGPAVALSQLTGNPDLRLVTASDINERGQIVGTALVDSVAMGYVATPRARLHG